MRSQRGSARVARALRVHDIVPFCATLSEDRREPDRQAIVSINACILPVNPPRDRPMDCLLFRVMQALLMHTDNRPVDHLHGSVMGASESVHDPWPRRPLVASERSGCKPSGVRTEVVWQIALRCS
jgi:hypothetical protein